MLHGWKPVLVLASAKPKSCNNKNNHYLKSTGFIWLEFHTVKYWQGSTTEKKMKLEQCLIQAPLYELIIDQESQMEKNMIDLIPKTISFLCICISAWNIIESMNIFHFIVHVLSEVTTFCIQNLD